ncbi:Glyoxalase/Bleomycin resistance protein/Dihydroxybiphenyl dioxygenase [Fusarium solani]|uniref:Glyoxalase/Bleomycin resistance protein/Dihydroxybiphenyl dioxygenase n=1 Tax=Fusarium solani TaxID=169388 RepID=A0A9P9K8K0_FUSSL|nr:Glyoxalase/Bleomycin resistance protein/Dihydroxybiphenyl dioxygenase [Fusarium solani]KAH7243929.1 Glyoxalase/Bleomycin resistance protein/Dihydroxybiphenyl dioxygenase [Fusarium solani]
MALNVNSHTWRAHGLQFNHVGLSVANISAQSQFYRSIMEFENVVRNFTIHAPELFQVVQLQNAQGVIIELVQNADSTSDQSPKDPMDGSKVQGYFHWALMVGDLEGIFAYITRPSTGCRAVSPPAPDDFHVGGRYAYVADPEGNLIELLSTPIN